MDKVLLVAIFTVSWISGVTADVIFVQHCESSLQ